MILNWSTTKGDALLILKITTRARKMQIVPGHDPLGLNMDITATHINGCPLKLEELLGADDFNFAHDVLGIYKHLDRKTGKLTDCFVPRFAKS